MFYLKVKELMELVDKAEPKVLLQAIINVNDETDLPPRVKGDLDANLHRVEAFTDAMLNELKKGDSL